jgi:hypothetical protein
MPDTPAPVFAARAFKSALFGTPVRDAQRASRDKARVAKPTAFTLDQGSDTPLKPQGILLTPGTGASRRKRVSFNHDLATTKTISPNNEGIAVSKRTRLSDVLDKARRKSTTNVSNQTENFPIKDESDESDWEEEELYDENGEIGGHDPTVDLNEPHSQSGKYWKEQFEKYHQEARAEMEKLLKYKKHLKSYAEEKDLEAIHLAQRLKEEQEKVVAMEKKITENANYMVSKQKGASNSSETTELLATLTKQTALAAQYRHRVQELEAQLEELHQGREDDEEAREWRRLQGTTSPNTAKTIIETQRELRRSRAQLKELDALRSQVSSLKAQLKTSEQRRFTDYSTTDDPNDTVKVRDLKAQLRQAKEEASTKDDELRQMKKEFDTFKKESEVHDADIKAVLERAQTKISELKKEVKTLKAGEAADTAQPGGWNRKFGNDKVAKDINDEEILSRPPVATNGVRRSIDVADLARPRQLPEASSSKLRTLRDKYRRDATPKAATKSRDAAEVLGDQSNDEKLGWQPFFSRSSTKRRGSVSREAPKRNQVGSEVLVSSGEENIGLLKVPRLAKPTIHPKSSSSSDDIEAEVDLLQDHFARLGGPDAGKGKLKDVSNDINSKRSLPPERRAAALARIEKRMAEKRARRRDGTDKENVRP